MDFLLQPNIAKTRVKEVGDMANENGQENSSVRKSEKYERMARNGERAAK